MDSRSRLTRPSLGREVDVVVDAEAAVATVGDSEEDVEETQGMGDMEAPETGAAVATEEEEVEDTVDVVVEEEVDTEMEGTGLAEMEDMAVDPTEVAREVTEAAREAMVEAVREDMVREEVMAATELWTSDHQENTVFEEQTYFPNNTIKILTFDVSPTTYYVSVGSVDILNSV